MDKIIDFILALLFIVMVNVCILNRLVRSTQRKCDNQRLDMIDSENWQTRRMTQLTVACAEGREELLVKLDEGLMRIRAEVDSANSVCMDSLKKTNEELTELSEKLKKVDELIGAHAEAEAEAAKSERLFQEGLSNILNYGVKNSG